MVTYMSYFRNMPRVYLLDIETGTQDIVGNFPGMTFAPRFSQMEKNYHEFQKDGNSDIYTMELDTRIVERITEHSSIDTSPSFPRWKVYFSTQTEVDCTIYVMRSVAATLKELWKNHGTPVWSPRGDLIAFTKMHKGKFYIGVMRTDERARDF